MGKHARPKGQDTPRLTNLRKMAASLREAYRSGQVDESSYKRLAESYNKDIAEEEKNCARGV